MNALSHVSSRRLLLGVVGALSLTSLALGQSQAPPIPGVTEEPKLKPPVPAPPRSEASDMLGIGLALVLGVAAAGVNMIPGRRGHQD
jgi:hypothetical protein